MAACPALCPLSPAATMLARRVARLPVGAAAMPLRAFCKGTNHLEKTLDMCVLPRPPPLPLYFFVGTACSVSARLPPHCALLCPWPGFLSAQSAASVRLGVCLRLGGGGGVFRQLG
eukprot:SAG31_NODE_5488_length_2511_cov_1.810531_3_plen_116_part_00